MVVLHGGEGELIPPRAVLLVASASGIPTAASLFMAFTNVSSQWMEDAVIGVVFVVCHGFRDNGDGM